MALIQFDQVDFLTSVFAAQGTNTRQVGLNLSSGSVTFTGGAWTFPVGTTAVGLFVTGTPVDGNHVTNKTYVDSKITGLEWKDPAAVDGLVGNATVTVINGLTPLLGDSYVTTSAGAITGGGTAAIGDIWQCTNATGPVWTKVITGAGGFVPANTRVIISTTTALITPYTDATDDGKIMSFTGASNTGVNTSEAYDGAALLIHGEGALNENKGFVFDGAVPTGSWILFAGGTYSAGNGLQLSSATFSVRADSTTGANIQPVNVTGNGTGLDINAIAGTGIEADGSANLRIASTAAGDGLAGGSGSALSLDLTSKGGLALTGSSPAKTLNLDFTATYLDAIGEALAVGDLFAVWNVSGTPFVKSCTSADIATYVKSTLANLTQGAGNSGIVSFTYNGSSTATVAVDASEGIQLDANGVAVNLTVSGTGFAGLVLTGTTGAKTLGVSLEAAGSATGGLEFNAAGAVKVNPADGIALDANGVSVSLESLGSGTGGLRLVGTAGSKLLGVDPSDGVTLDSNGVAVNLETAGAGTGGLRLVGTAGSKTLGVDPSDGIVLDSNGVALNLTSVGGLGLTGTAGSKTLNLDFSSGGLTEMGADIATADRFAIYDATATAPSMKSTSPDRIAKYTLAAISTYVLPNQTVITGSGSTAIYDLGHVLPTGWEKQPHVYRNGVRLKYVTPTPGQDQYKISVNGGTGGVGQLTLGFNLKTGDEVLVDYLYIAP